MLMTQLAEPAHVNVWLLVLSGIIMATTLFLSRDAMKVAETQINLSSQNDEDERFGSSRISRAMVNTAININRIYTTIIPKSIQERINRRFEADENADDCGSVTLDKFLTKFIPYMVTLYQIYQYDGNQISAAGAEMTNKDSFGA